MAGSAEPCDDPLADPAGVAHQTHEDIWTPPLTGRTLGGLSSPEPSPSAHNSSAWERVAKRSHYWHHEDRGDLGTGLKSDRDVDTISLDSLQMHDEVDRDAGDKFQTDYDTYKRTLAAQPSLPLKPPANVKIRRTSGLAIWLLVMSIYSTIMSAIWLGAAIAEPRWGTTVSSHGAMTLSTANLVTAILAKTIEMSFVTVFVAFIGQVLTRRAITTKEGMTLSEMSMRTWVTVSGTVVIPTPLLIIVQLTSRSATWLSACQRQDTAVRGQDCAWHTDTGRHYRRHLLHDCFRYDGCAQATVQ